MHTLEQKIKKSGFINGLILGAITLALNILSFYIITSSSVSPLLFILAPIISRAFIPMLVVIFFSFNIRKNVGGLWTFKQATTGIFIMLMVAYLVNLAGKDMIFDKVIEPNGIQKTQMAAINAKASNMKEKGASQDKINASIDKEINDCVTFAENSPYPDDSELYKHIYVQEDYPFLME